VIYNQGDVGRFLYIIIEGEVEILEKQENSDDEG